MILAIAIGVAVFWVAAGIASFIYWWTSEYDMTVSMIGFAVAVGIFLGPFAFLVGWRVHRKRANRDIIVFRARTKK